MLRYYIFFLQVLAICSFSQTKKIQSLVGQLDNTQFIISHSEKAAFTFKSKAALKLIRKGKSASGALIEALNDSAKNIMTQLVLCHIYYGKATFAGPKMITDNDVHVNLYFLGDEKGPGLVINEVKKEGSYRLFVKPEDIEKAKTYWKNLAGGKK